MTTPARPGQFTGATDNEANGGLFTDSKIDGIPDLVAADVASAQTSATNAAASATTATTQATTATTKATEASTSATAAANSATAAATSATNAASSATTASNAVSSVSTNATNAATSETNAATSATNAAASASTASTQATSATTQANSALSSASAAAISATNAANSFDSFDDRYLGAKNSDPSTDNDNQALLTGALYYKNNDGIKVYNGSAWEDVKPTSSEQTNINTVAAANSNITAVAGNAANINAVGAISANVTSVANIASDVTSLANSLEKTYTVTVVNPGSGNFFYLDGAAYPAIEMFRGNTYIFDQSAASNDGHPLVFKNGSSAYETGVSYFLNGAAATQSNYVNVSTFNAGRSSGARKVQIEIASDAPSTGLRYYCYVHGNGMGNTITVKDSNVSLVAGSIANVNNTGNNIANVNTVGGAIANVNTVATNITGVNSFNDRYRVASSAPTSSLDAGDLYFDTSSNLLKVYNGSAFQSTAPSAADQNNINIVAGEVTAQEDLGSIANAVSTSSGSNINTVGQNISNVNTVAGISSNVTSVAGNSSNINTVAGISANVTTVAGISSNVTAVAGNATNINAVNSNATNINTVAGAAANVNTVAANVTGVNSFAERYRVASSAPTSSLDTGDLFYNTTANSLNYYNGSTFVPIVAGAMTSLVVDTTPQLGGDLDVNGNAIVSASNGNIALTPNGSGKVVISSPQLASNLDVNGNSIVSVSNGDITIAPNGSGEINLNGTVNTDNLTIDFGSIA